MTWQVKDSTQPWQAVAGSSQRSDPSRRSGKQKSPGTVSPPPPPAKTGSSCRRCLSSFWLDPLCSPAFTRARHPPHLQDLFQPEAARQQHLVRDQIHGPAAGKSGRANQTVSWRAEHRQRQRRNYLGHGTLTKARRSFRAGGRTTGRGPRRYGACSATSTPYRLKARLLQAKIAAA